MRKRFFGFTLNPAFTPILFLVISLAAYGWLVLRPGLFGDDPQLLYSFHRYSLAGYESALGWSRPFGIWIYALLYPILGEHLALWQLCALLLRTLGAWLLFLLMARIRPEWRVPALWAGLACLLYPGFSQQAHSLQFMLHWAALCVSLASQILMLKSLKIDNIQKSLALSLISLLLAGLGIFSTEYFVGLELVRPFILWLYLRRDGEKGNSFMLAFRRWLPYLSLLLIFCVWRLFAARISYPRPLLLEDLARDPRTALGSLLARIPSDLWKSGLLAWAEIFNSHLTALDSRVFYSLRAGLSILFGVLLWGGHRQPGRRRNLDVLILAGLGLLFMLVGGAPLWIAKVPLELTFPENRTVLCYLPGACLLLAGLLRLLPDRAGWMIICLLLGFSGAYQINLSLDYDHAWQQMRGFIWQMTECAPGLESDTLILYEEPFIPYYPANSHAALINWTYAPDREEEIQPYDVFRISERLGNKLPALAPNIPVRHGAFQGNTSQVLVIRLDEEGCLHFLQPNMDADTEIPEILRQAALISNPDVIIPDQETAARPPAFMGKAPDLVGCACFQ